MSKPTKAQNPDMDFGFYAGIPRVVRTGYKDVSPVQKWLYVCLKDLAGDDGTCYRTIRSLVEETGLSAGMISESILVLHKAGLIHAEKKKRSTGGKEVWHISIVDIWKKNGEVHPTKRSQDEQSTSYKNVHDMNVHHTNNNSPVCSPTEHKRSQDEQECSRGETEERTISRPVSKNITEEKQSTYSAPVETAASGTDVPPRALSSQSDLSTQATSEQDNVARENETHSQLSTSQASYPRESAKVEPRPSTYQPPARVRNKSSKNKADYRISWSVEGAAFRGWYEELTGVVLDETAANARACNALAKRSSVTYDNLRRVLGAIDADKWVHDNNVAITVQDLASDDGKQRWERWLQVAMRSQRRITDTTSKSVPTREQDPYSIAALLEDQNPGYHARKAEMEAASWRK